MLLILRRKTENLALILKHLLITVCDIWYLQVRVHFWAVSVQMKLMRIRHPAFPWWPSLKKPHYTRLMQDLCAPLRACTHCVTGFVTYMEHVVHVTSRAQCLCTYYLVTLTKSLSSFDGKHLGDCHVAARVEPWDGKLIETGSRVLCVKPALERSVHYFWLRHS